MKKLFTKEQAKQFLAENNLKDASAMLVASLRLSLKL